MIGLKKKVASYVILVLGAIIQGMAMSLFLFPHSIPSGGAAGLAILTNYFFNVPLGLGLWFSNAVFLIFAIRFFGFPWTIRTIISVGITSTTVSFLTQFTIPHIHLIIDLICGAILFGIGVGMLIRVGSSSGGMVIPALMIARMKKWHPGKVMLGINLFIFLLTSVTIEYTIIVYAIICQFISTNIIDQIFALHLGEIKQFALSWRRK